MKIFLILVISILYGATCIELDDVCLVNGVEFGVVKRVAKCEHVMKLLVEKNVAEVEKLSITGNSSQLLFCCPARKAIRACKGFGSRPEEPQMISSRVVNGVAAEAGEFPYFAALAYDSEPGKISFECAGSLISGRFVLTASHCVRTSRMPIFVRLGKVAIEFFIKG